MMNEPGKKWLGVSLGLGFGLWSALAAAQEAPKPAAKAPDPRAVEFFESKIRPLFAQQCNVCHSGAKPKGGLALDTPEGLAKGGDTGAAILPGSPEKSLLLDAVGYAKDLKMPPQGKLKPQQIADLAAWVKMGAPWPNFTGSFGPSGKPANGALFTEEQKKFWAFQPVREPKVPAVKDRAWVKSPIDAFILAGLEAKGMKPAPPADRRTLIRRVSFDLTGLPPTPTEIDAFLADRSPDAYAKVIDRLLASPAYGERWARHWLDVARYADSNGLDENTAFANAWRYRDYVVNAFNQDKPYDQFVKEQLAGDLLPETGDPAVSAERLTATGFLGLGPKVLAEPDKQKMVMDIVDEQIDTTGKAFMGLTLGCARCHDHKFDPIPTRDYYSLAGIFKSTRTMATLNTVARVLERPLADSESVKRQEEHQRLVQEKQRELKQLTDRLTSDAANAVLGKAHEYLLLAREAAVVASADTDDVDVSVPGALVWEAEKFVRGDVQVTSSGYGEGIGIIESAGRSTAFTEYAVELPQPGEFRLALRYASGEPRPVNVSLDGKPVKTGAAGLATGGFDPRHQQWHAEDVVFVAAGKHTVRVDQAAGALPHLDKLALLPVVGAPAPGAARKPTTAELAQAHGLNPDVLRRVAMALQRGRQRKDDPVFGPWNQLAALPADRFAPEAARLVAEWKSAGTLASFASPVAALFAGDAPRSLDEAAQRYEELFRRVSDAWLQAERRAGKKPPTRLPESGMEAVRQALFGNRGAFGLDRPEKLYPAASAQQVAKLKTEVENLEKNGPANLPLVIAVEDDKTIANQKVCIRGNHLALGEEAPRQFLRIVAGEQQQPITEAHSGRLELAEWLTSPTHPLTARVMMNRIWLHHFGEGIVRSPDNFGKLGERPTHPELLDWLARRFMEKGWSMKAMHRMILLSNAYQMSTRYNPDYALKDPENRLLWRFNRHRLEVEAIRDSVLAVAGNLDHTMGGTLLMTPDFGYVTNDQSGNGARYDAPRRSIYLPVIRNAVFDVFQVFDFVEPSLENGQRATTTVAPQALFMMNGPFVLSESKVFAAALLALPAADEGARVDAAYRRAFGRPAAPDEIAAAQGYLQRYAAKLSAKDPDAGKRREKAWQSFCQILFASNEFVYVN